MTPWDQVPGGQPVQEDSFAPMAMFGAMRMMSFSEPEPEGFSTFADESEGAVTTFADPAPTIIFTVTDQYGGIQTVTVPVPEPAQAGVSVGQPDHANGGAVTAQITAVDDENNPVDLTQTLKAGSGPTYGTATYNSQTNTWTYKPFEAARHAAADVATPGPQEDSFVVTTTDEDGNVVDLTVTVPIDPNNANPDVTANPTQNTDGNGVVTGTVSTTDTDAGDTPTYSSTNGGKGTVSVNPTTGAWTYTPNAGERHNAAATTGDDTDSFTITVTDGHGGTDTQTVAVTITPANNEPDLSANPTQNTDGNGVVTGTVSTTDTDAGDTPTYSSTNGGKGTVSVNPTTGAWTYTPNAGERHNAAATTGDDTDSFTITVTDGHGGTDTQTVAVTITPANNVPSVSDNGTRTDGVNGSILGAVTTTDTDLTDTPAYTVGTQGTKGTVAVNPDGTWTYTPTAASRHDAAATGASTADKTDTFTITVTDGHGGTATTKQSPSTSLPPTTPRRDHSRPPRHTQLRLRRCSLRRHHRRRRRCGDAHTYTPRPTAPTARSGQRQPNRRLDLHPHHHRTTQRRRHRTPNDRHLHRHRYRRPRRHHTKSRHRQHHPR